MGDRAEPAGLRPASGERRYAGVLLRDRDGAFILQQYDAPYPLVTTFGGAVEPGETAIDAAVREVEEELGLRLSRHLLEPLATLPKFDRGDVIRCEYFRYLAPVDVEGRVPLDGDRIVFLPASDRTGWSLPLTSTTLNALEQAVRIDRGTTPAAGSTHNAEFVSAYAENHCLTFDEAVRWLELLRSRVLSGDDISHSGPVRVLDLGTGPGRFLPLLSHAFGSQYAFGVDVSYAMAHRASRTGFSVACADAIALPFLPARFDVVWCVQVWHLLAGSWTACRAVHRILRERGFFVLRTAFVDQASRGALFEYFPSARAIQARRYPAKSELLRDLQTTGFARIEHDGADALVAPTFDAYVQKVRSRAYSILWEIGEAEYHAGLQRMEADLAGGRSEAVSMPCDIIVAIK